MAEFVCLFAWLTHFRANQPFSSFFQSVFFPGHNEAAPEIQWEPETALHNHGFQFSMTPRKWSVPLLYIIYIILCIIWFTFQSFSIITYLTCFFLKTYPYIWENKLTRMFHRWVAQAPTSREATKSSRKITKDRHTSQSDDQWIGLRENIQETIDFPMKYGTFL